MARLLAVLIDLSGTIHVEDKVIPGAIEAIKRLRKLPNVKVKFVTNTSKESGKVLYDRLVRIGFDIKPSEIFTSLTAARRLVEERNLRPMLLLEDVALDDFEGLSTSNPNAVVIGLAPSHFHYERLTAAFRLVLDGAPLIAVHKGRYYKRDDGIALGPGAFIQGLEYSTDTKAEVVGKPEKSFFLSGLKAADPSITPENAIMIGDDARDDVGGAQAIGMKGILVKTGKFREGDEHKIPGGPFKLCDSAVEAIDWIIDEYS